MESFKIADNFGSHCDECGQVLPNEASVGITVKGVQYTLCKNCFKRFIGEIYLAKPEVVEEFIKVLGKKDRVKILGLING